MLASYQALTDDLVRDDSGKITASERDWAITRAVAKYSGDRPRVTVEDVAAETQNLLPLPAGWVRDFSLVRAIEYPVDRIPPVYLDQDRYGTYQQAGQSWPNKVMLLDAVNVGTLLRVSYTIRHQVDVAFDTIRTDDTEAVCRWAAALLLEQLASLFAGDSFSSIQADVVNHGSKAAEYGRRAEKMRKGYYDLLGLEEKTAEPAGVFVNLDQLDSRGQDRLTHPRKFR